MGASTDWVCGTCGYSAVASGGPDVGMIARTESCVCASCRNIVDVVVDQRADGDFQDVPRRCPECRSSRVEPWAADHPCPRCGGTMEEGNTTIILWD